MPKYYCSECRAEFESPSRFPPFACPNGHRGACTVPPAPGAALPKEPETTAKETPQGAGQSAAAPSVKPPELRPPESGARKPPPFTPRVPTPPAETPAVSESPRDPTGPASPTHAPTAATTVPVATQPVVDRPLPPRPTRPRDPDQLVWRYPSSDSAGSPAYPLRGAPAVDSQGRMFVCIADRLLMFAPGARTPAWEYLLGGLTVRAPAIGPDGNVRVHGGGGFLHVVDPGGQRVFDPVNVGEPLGWASPLVDGQNSTWICRSEGGLIKVDSHGSPGPRPFYRTRRRFDSTGLILGGILYLGCEDHYVYAIPLHADEGDNLWASSPDLGRTGCAINCPLAMPNRQELLAASQDDRLYGFGLDGRQHWAIPMPGHMLGSPVVDAQGTIFVGVSHNPREQDATGVLLSIDRASRQVRWRYRADAPIESTPAIGDDGNLYFGDNAGSIHALDSQGRLLWKAEFEAPVRSAGTIVGPGLVAFGLDSGSLVVLKCSSQQICAAGWPKISGTLRQSGLVTES